MVIIYIYIIMVVDNYLSVTKDVLLQFSHLVDITSATNSIKTNR